MEDQSPPPHPPPPPPPGALGFSDVPAWKPCIDGNYSVHSYHRFINRGGTHWQFYKTIWKASVLEMVKVFLWLVLVNRLHTMEILFKKGRRISNGYVLCGARSRTALHLFIRCPFA